MMAILYRSLTAALLAAGAAGLWLDVSSLAPYGSALLALGGLLLANDALSATYYRSGTPWPQASSEPQPLRIGWLDYVKAAISWLDAFKRTYVVEPGLYYTGDRYDRGAPLLVTSNYRLTVFLVTRRVRAFNTRLLVVDTDGINVWCAAGKGEFGNQAILAQIRRYPRSWLTQDKWLRLILPKFGLAGVDLRSLRKHGIRPIIGPLYARDLPAYLAEPPLRDRDDDSVVFGLQMRAFSWLPGLKQMVGYSLLLVIFFVAAQWLWGSSVPVGLVAISAFVATAYPLLYPWIPGGRFAVKGLWLGAIAAAGLGLGAAAGLLAAADLVASIPFTLATGLFFGLAYTGNSAVSNYTRVRKETAQFLVPDVALFAVSLLAFVVMELKA
jgi:acetyl-CoA decarbonylase/synthase complex subunit gamma